MKYGCIGEHLSHSFSKEIHALIAEYGYEICEIPREKLDAFMKKKDFRAINVTIPYKEAVIPYLDTISGEAAKIGAVNTIVNRDGKLYGYNTDFFGMTALIKKCGIELENKKVAVLGSGGTSRTAFTVSESLGAEKTLRVSRTAKDGAIDYETLYRDHGDTEIIINTTPCGMYPKFGSPAADISKFPYLTGVIDAVYNPLRTELIIEARKRGVKSAGGLYMLVAQGVRASEIFLDKTYEHGICEKTYRKILSDKENIILTGMPASGKSTVGKIIAEKLGRKFFDTDEIIENETGIKISDIFAKYGEKHFRDIENKIIKDKILPLSSAVVATGGGVPLREENIDALRQNGRIYFIDRPLEFLVPTCDRPLASSKEQIEKRYYERYDIYRRTCDVTIDADGDADYVANKIIGDFQNENIHY